MRMECCPRRVPLSASNRLPGGTLKNARSTAASIIWSLIKARCQISVGKRRVRPVIHSFFVSGSAKLRITSEPASRSIIRQADNVLGIARPYQSCQQAKPARRVSHDISPGVEAHNAVSGILPGAPSGWLKPSATLVRPRSLKGGRAECTAPRGPREPGHSCPVPCLGHCNSFATGIPVGWSA